MHRLLICWYFSLLIPFGAFAQPPYLQEGIAEVQSKLQDYTGPGQTYSDRYGVEVEFVLAVIGPELIRYGEVRDLLETGALEIGYVEWGELQADFSIGPFQMKPSFIEHFEQAWARHPYWGEAFRRDFQYSSSHPKKIRRERLERMKSPVWQLRYAAAFCALVQDLTDPCWSVEDRLTWVATAYNYGFHRPPAEIQAWQVVERFPYGAHFRGPQMAYGEVSRHLYAQLHNWPLITLTKNHLSMD
jgi:hypothetical protein